MAVKPDDRYLYVTNSGPSYAPENTVSVIGAGAHTVTKSIPVGVSGSSQQSWERVRVPGRHARLE